MAMTRQLILLVLTAAFATAADRPDLPSDLTLNEALAIALNNSTVIRNAQAALEQATGRYAQARSPSSRRWISELRQNLQTVNLIGIGIPIAGATGKIGPFGSMDARIFVSQEIFNLANRRSWKSSRAREDSSRLMVNNARELVALNVVATYLDALQS